MAAGRRSSWRLIGFVLIFVIALQATVMLLVYSVAYIRASKERLVHRGMTVAQVEQVLGQPIPNGIKPIGIGPGGEERTYNGALGSQIHIQYQNGVAAFVFDYSGVGFWKMLVVITGFNLWCLFTAIPFTMYRALASPRGEFRYRKMFAMPRFSMSRMLLSMTAVILGIAIFVLLFKYGIADGADWTVGLPLICLGVAMIGGGIGSLFYRPGFGALVVLWVLISLPYFGLVMYAMHPAIG
jgi:hypothetical protein